MSSVPSLEEVAERLSALIDGTLQRREASLWAHTWVANDDAPQVDDEDVWEVLGWIAMANLPGYESEYLYQEEDFRSWLAEVEAAIESRR